MKKSLGILLTVLLVIVSFSTLISASTRTVVENYDEFADTADLQTKVIVGYGNPTIALDTVNKDGDTGASMQYTVGSGWNVVVSQGGATDWTGTSALKFWVKVDTSGMTTPTTYTKIWVAFDEADPWKRWSAGSGVPYVIQAEGGDPVSALTTTDGQNSFVVSDGFEGYITIPMSSFIGDGTMNLSAISQFLFQTADYFAGTKINIDSVELIKDVTVDNYDSFVDTADLQTKVIVGYGNPTIALDTVNKDGDTGASMQYTVGSGWNVVVSQGGVTDWTGAEALKFWVKADTSGMTTPTTYTKIWVAFDETDPWKRWSAGSGMPYLIQAEGGEPVSALTTTDGQNSFVVPDGFEGYITIPMSSFIGDGTMNLSSICQFLFQTADYFAGTKINIDSVQLLGSFQMPAPEVPIAFNVIDPDEFGFTATPDDGSFNYDVDLTIGLMDQSTNAFTNISDTIKGYYNNADYADFLIFNMSAIQTGTTNNVDLPSGKQCQVTMNLPDGYNSGSTKILLFAGGDVQVETPSIVDGKLVFSISTFAPFAVADETNSEPTPTPTPSATPTVTPTTAAESTPTATPTSAESPQTADAGTFGFVMMLVFAAMAAILVMHSRRANAER